MQRDVPETGEGEILLRVRGGEAASEKRQGAPRFVEFESGLYLHAFINSDCLPTREK